MRNRYPEFFLIDIFIAIGKIKRFTKHCKTIEDFVNDELIFSATLRELEIIGEAMKHVLNYQKFQDLINPEWKLIVDFRNVLTHEYFGIDFDIAFDVVFHDIDILESELLALVKKLKDKDAVLHVVTRVKQDLKKSHQTESLLNLEALEKQIRQV
jgi:uncharacterized protein with HEPN domain